MPAPKGNKNALKPGDDTRLSLRYNKADTELLRKAWELETKNHMTTLCYKEWLTEMVYRYPISEAKRITAFYEEES